MSAQIDYADELDPLLAVELPPGWVRGLRKPVSMLLSEDASQAERALLEDLIGDLSEQPSVATQLVFAYLGGYDPSTERPMRNERRVGVKYIPDRDAFAVTAEFDEGLVDTADDVEDWLDSVLPRVERELDERRRLWVTLSDIHSLGRQGIGNLYDEYGSVESVASAIEAELVDVPYVTADLAPEVLTACEQFDGTVPTAPGEDVAADADDPLVIEEGLRPFAFLFD